VTRQKEKKKRGATKASFAKSQKKEIRAPTERKGLKSAYGEGGGKMGGICKKSKREESMHVTIPRGGWCEKKFDSKRHTERKNDEKKS